MIRQVSKPQGRRQERQDSGRAERGASSGGRQTGGSSRKKFVYKERTAEDVQEHANQTGGGFDSIYKPNFDTYKFEEGSNTFRVLPPTWGDHKHYGYKAEIHGFIGAGKSSYLCLKMIGEQCPICEAAEEARENGEEDEYKQLAAKTSYICWVIDRDDRDGETKPKLIRMSWTMDRTFAALCHNKKTGAVLLIDHPEKGFDLTVQRKGKTKNSTDYYGHAVDRESSPICEDERDQDEVLEYIEANPIPDVLNYYDADHLSSVINFQGEQADEGGEVAEEGKEDDKGNTRERRGSRSRRNGDDKDNGEGEGEGEENPNDLAEGEEMDEETGEVTTQEERNDRGSSRRSSRNERGGRRGREEPADKSEEDPPFDEEGEADAEVEENAEDGEEGNARDDDRSSRRSNVRDREERPARRDREGGRGSRGEREERGRPARREERPARRGSRR